jgi:hypothetical protein
MNRDNLNNVRQSAGISGIELARNSKNKNIRDLYKGINEFKRGYKKGSNLGKDANGDLLADSHKILNMWKHYFSRNIFT